MTDYERTTAAELSVGDRIARTRKGPFLTVTELPATPGGYIRQAWTRDAHLQAADIAEAKGDRRRLVDHHTGAAAMAALHGYGLHDPCEEAGRIRPRATAKLWRVAR